MSGNFIKQQQKQNQEQEQKQEHNKNKQPKACGRVCNSDADCQAYHWSGSCPNCDSNSHRCVT